MNITRIILALILGAFAVTQTYGVTVFNTIKCSSVVNDPADVLIKWNFNSEASGQGVKYTASTFSFCGKRNSPGYQFFVNTDVEPSVYQADLYLQSVDISYTTNRREADGKPIILKKTFDKNGLYFAGCSKSLNIKKNLLDNDDTIVALGSVVKDKLTFKCGHN